jgi:hypothetical protein
MITENIKNITDIKVGSLVRNVTTGTYFILLSKKKGEGNAFSAKWLNLATLNKMTSYYYSTDEIPVIAEMD